MFKKKSKPVGQNTKHTRSHNDSGKVQRSYQRQFPLVLGTRNQPLIYIEHAIFEKLNATQMAHFIAHYNV